MGLPQPLGFYSFREDISSLIGLSSSLTGTDFPNDARDLPRGSRPYQTDIPWTQWGHHNRDQTLSDELQLTLLTSSDSSGSTFCRLYSQQRKYNYVVSNPRHASG
jgi:hypothetical protein